MNDGRDASKSLAHSFASTNAVLEPSPLAVDYAELRDPERWTKDSPAGPLEQAVALVAARCGPVRLIDNMILGTDG